MKQVLPLLLLVISLTGVANAQTPLEKGFAKPPASAKPSVYWWWLFNRVDKAGITRDLEQFKAKGIGQVNLICTGGYAGDRAMLGVKFLGQEWRELFRHAVKEVKRLNLEMGFNMAGGWSLMGPWVTQDNAMKKVTQSELKLKGPMKFSGNLPEPETVDGYYRDIRVQAFRTQDKSTPIDTKDIVDISDRWRADRNFQWDVPAGDWTILRTGYTLTGSKWYSYPAGDTFLGGEGYQVDYMNPISIDNYFNYLGKIVLGEAKKAGGRLKYLWTDSWEAGKLTWTQEFQAEFRKYRGYDLTPYLPVLNGLTVGSTEASSRFKADFDRTIADCLAENYYGQFAKLCHDNGVGMRSEAAGPGDNPPMDALRNLGRCDVPAGEFWVNGHFGASGGWNSNPGLRSNLKEVSSAGHIYGKGIVQAEAFTQQEADRTHWSLGPADLKPYGDNAYCEGINYFMLHQATCQLSTDGKPGYEFCAGQHWNPSITWWDQSAAVFGYFGRCQYMLQQGLFVGDVCYYLGETTPIVAPYKQYDLAGYDGDYCNPDVLLTRMSVKNGRVMLPDGMSYRILVLQNCTSTSQEVCNVIGGSIGQRILATPSTAMSLNVLKKIQQLVRDGATVVGAKPEKAVGLADYPNADKEVQALAAEIWGDCDGKTRTEHVYGKGRVIWGKPLKDILRDDAVKPDFTYAQQAAETTASWIWHAADGSNPPVCERIFQREINIRSIDKIESALINVTADNQFELRVNGVEVCRGVEWSKLVSADLKKYLVQGKNILSVRVKNTDIGPAGLLVIGKVDLGNGDLISLDTLSGDWESSADEKNWAPVKIVVGYGNGPWGNVGNLKVRQLDYIHRVTGDADIYFVSNRKNYSQSQDCTFRVIGKQPEIWDPNTGSMRDASAFKQSDGRTTLPLDFAAFESYFVVFRKPISAGVSGKSTRNFAELSAIQDISHSWNVSFGTHLGGPVSAEFADLVSWTSRPEEGIKYYSGKATYRKTFNLDREQISGGRVYLDLGKVQHVAEVRLNGKNLGTLWTAPWHVDITNVMRASGNTLEIDVINLWVNRVVGDLNLPKEKRIAVTHDLFRFDMVRPITPLIDSGLMGPVTIQREIR